MHNVNAKRKTFSYLRHLTLYCRIITQTTQLVKHFIPSTIYTLEPSWVISKENIHYVAFTILSVYLYIYVAYNFFIYVCTMQLFDVIKLNKFKYVTN